MHSHAHERGQDIGKLRVALATTLSLLVLEAIGGLLSGSMVLLADAAHLLTDAGAAALALWAARIARRRADDRRTFGYGRATVLAALTNAAALFAIVVLLAVFAVERLREPVAPNTTLMIGVAVVAIAVNILLALFLSRGENNSMNVRGVRLHVVGDATISAAVIVAAIIVRFTGFVQADPIASIVASVAVGYAAWALVRDALRVLMEGVPEGLDLSEVNDALLALPSIDAVHDLHVWSVSDSSVAASVHVRIQNKTSLESQGIVAEAKELLHQRFNISHATIEVECEDCGESC